MTTLHSANTAHGRRALRILAVFPSAEVITHEGDQSMATVAVRETMRSAAALIEALGAVGVRVGPSRGEWARVEVVWKVSRDRA